MTDGEHHELLDLLRKRETQLPIWARALLVLGGVLCFLVGIALGPVPVVPGIPFYVIGLVLFAAASRRVCGLINRTERRFPHKLRMALRRWVKKLPFARHGDAEAHRKSEPVRDPSGVQR